MCVCGGGGGGVSSKIMAPMSFFGSALKIMTHMSILGVSSQDNDSYEHLGGQLIR